MTCFWCDIKCTPLKYALDAKGSFDQTWHFVEMALSQSRTITPVAAHISTRPNLDCG